MLGFEGGIFRVTPPANINDLLATVGLPYPAVADAVQELLVKPPVAQFRVPGSVTLDLVAAARADRAMLLHDGGYPYIVAGSASLFRDVLVPRGEAIPVAIDDSELLVLVSWDQS